MSGEIAFEIEHSPAYASLRLQLQPNQSVLIESGAMAAMDSGIQMKSRMQGGMMQGLGRMMSGESLFISEFTAQGKGGEIFVSPAVPGDIEHYSLQGNGLRIQSSGFLASSPTVAIETGFEGGRGFFSGEGLFLVRATGEGDLWFNSYGAIVEIPVSGEYVVDTGYIVAFEESLNYSVENIGGLSFRGLATGVFGGEGLVCRFQGTGRLWVQSRSLLGLLNFFQPFRPVSSSNN
ncbi:TIGR00266 family protein [Phormidium sp. CCY1219]|uniref:TIGR00266 family protein n=1 Tax=Phormidium sp. CCY1219 TaxID=2886104 RepID=UPI002D1E6D17|nr:TIGR00266 family protein [Phormidium sp. CCY1219]MEB3829271.1 TIGR00266 family protein [Phormidium sp. CCY1219]